MNPVQTDEQAILDIQVDAAMGASRVFVGIVVASTDEVESIVTLRQLRTLVILATHGRLNLAALAERLGIHPSNATRLCDRLVESGLILRQQADHDRRHLELTPTRAGMELVDRVMARRRAALEKILALMPGKEREDLAATLRAFAVAAGEMRDDGIWPGYTT